MKEKLVTVLKTVLFLVILFSCFIVVSLVVQRKSSYDKNHMFMEEAKKDNIDVFILGSSHVINGINPIQLYEDHGITAYNLGGYGSVPMSSYWQFRMALDYCTPKLVIIDGYMLENDIRYVDAPDANVNSDELHLNIDLFPLNKTKYKAINDMFREQDKKYPFLFDFIVYHDRWKELDSNDFQRLTGGGDVNRLMGAVMNTDMHTAEFEYTEYDAGTLGRETVSTTYLRRIIDECNTRGIQVMVTTVPFLAMQENQAAANTCEQIAAEYGIKSLNMLKIPGLVDYNMDMADAGHLNILGCRKVTAKLGEFLADNYDLADHRGDAAYSVWEQCALDWHQDIKNKSKENPDIYAQMMTLQLVASDKTFVISIRGGSMVYADANLMRMLKALGAGSELDKAMAEKSAYMLTYDKGKIIERAGNTDADIELDTSGGKMTYAAVSDAYRILYLDKDADNNLIYSDKRAYVDLQLLFIDDEDVDAHQYYTCDSFKYSYEED